MFIRPLKLGFLQHNTASDNTLWHDKNGESLLSTLLHRKMDVSIIFNGLHENCSVGQILEIANDDLRWPWTLIRLFIHGVVLPQIFLTHIESTPLCTGLDKPYVTIFS